MLYFLVILLSNCLFSKHIFISLFVYCRDGLVLFLFPGSEKGYPEYLFIARGAGWQF